MYVTFRYFLCSLPCTSSSALASPCGAIFIASVMNVMAYKWERAERQSAWSGSTHSRSALVFQKLLLSTSLISPWHQETPPRTIWLLKFPDKYLCSTKLPRLTCLAPRLLINRCNSAPLPVTTPLPLPILPHAYLLPQSYLILWCHKRHGACLVHLLFLAHV